MYYRYKNKNKGGNRFIKYVCLLALITGLAWTAYQFRDDLKFWKFSFAMLEAQVEDVITDSHLQASSVRLQELIGKLDEYVDENPLDEEGYLLVARLLTPLGEELSDLNVTEFIAGNGMVADESLPYFFRSMRHIHKAFAIREDAPRLGSDILHLVKLYLYTGYYDNEYLYDFVRDVAVPEKLPGLQERRLYGFLTVKSGDGARGIKFIEDHCAIETVDDHLFLAGVYTLSRQYTDAIVMYRELLAQELPPDKEKRVRMSLGEVYLEQSLYNEALQQFSALIEMEFEDDRIRNKMARTYEALGEAALAAEYR